MRKKRILAVTMLLCLLLGLHPVQAAGTAQVSMSAASAEQGETVQIDVTISGNPGVAAWMFELDWDPAALVLEAGDEAVSPGEHFSSGTLLARPKAEGGLTVSWFALQDVKQDGILFSMKLKAVGQAGTYPVSITCSAPNTINVAEEQVAVGVTGTEITITGGNGEADVPSGGESEGGDTIIIPPTTEPVIPEEPEEPSTPSTPSTPVRPSTPSTPSVPTVPEQPEEPEEPKTPEVPEQSEPDKPAVTNPFADVKESDYFYEAVLWAVENGVTSGTSATTFSPAATCTRAQAVTFLWNAAGQPEPTRKDNPFADVSEGSWYYKPVLWALENGITSGTSATTFSPDANCTRAQTVTFLWNAAAQPQTLAGENPFADVSESDWYCKPVLWAKENGITSGTSATTFGSDDACQRGQMVTFLFRSGK